MNVPRSLSGFSLPAYQQALKMFLQADDVAALRRQGQLPRVVYAPWERNTHPLLDAALLTGEVGTRTCWNPPRILYGGCFFEHDRRRQLVSHARECLRFVHVSQRPPEAARARHAVGEFGRSCPGAHVPLIRSLERLVGLPDERSVEQQLLALLPQAVRTQAIADMERFLVAASQRVLAPAVLLTGALTFHGWCRMVCAAGHRSLPQRLSTNPGDEEDADVFGAETWLLRLGEVARALLERHYPRHRVLREVSEELLVCEWRDYLDIVCAYVSALLTVVCGKEVRWTAPDRLQGPKAPSA